MKKSLIVSLVLFGIFAILTILVKCVDVNTTADGIKIGLYNLNSKLLPTSASSTMDMISDICLYLSFVDFASVVGLGVYQLITRKSLKKVDLGIYVFAVVSVLVVIAYVLFDKIVINYRPILIDGKMEASYPSSHVLMTTFFAFGATYVYSSVIKNKGIVVCCGIVSGALSLISFLGRIMSMNHWLTDCIAGLVLALAFVMLLIAITEIVLSKTQKEKFEA